MRRIRLSCGMDILQIDDLRGTNIRMTDMITPGTEYYSPVIFKYFYETLIVRTEAKMYRDHGYFLGNIYKLKGKLDVAPLFTGGIRLGKESDRDAANREMFEESGLYCEKFSRKPYKTTSENGVNWTFYRGFFNSVRVDNSIVDYISKDDSKIDKVGVLVYGEHRQIRDICRGDIFSKELRNALRLRNSQEHIVDVCIIKVSEIREHLYNYSYNYRELRKRRTWRTFNTTKGGSESDNWRSRSTKIKSKSRRKKSVKKSKSRRKKSVRKSKSRRKKSVRKSKSRRKKSVRKSKSRRKKSVKKSKSRRKKSVRKSKSRGKPVKLSTKNSCKKSNFFLTPRRK